MVWSGLKGADGLRSRQLFLVVPSGSAGNMCSPLAAVDQQVPSQVEVVLRSSPLKTSRTVPEYDFCRAVEGFYIHVSTANHVVPY